MMCVMMFIRAVSPNGLRNYCDIRCCSIGFAYVLQAVSYPHTCRRANLMCGM